MLLSVIIPVYNVQQTLNRCVESVLCQGVDSMEVILVDDGSPDNSPTLCDEWARKDNRIRVIHKENGGLSDARNKGIDIATGDYITFVDSDDYLLPNTLKPLLDRTDNNKDIKLLEYLIRQEDSSRIPLVLEDKVFPSAKDYWLDTKAWNHSYACNKIYHRELFQGVRFPKGRLFEDLLTLPLLLKHCGKVATVNHGSYVYTVNEQGISKQTDRHTTMQLLKAELKAAWTMRTMPWSRNGKNLYYYIMCRFLDLIKGH